MAQMSKTKKPAGAFRTVRRMDTSTAGASQKKLTPKTQLNLQPGLTKVFKQNPEKATYVPSASASTPRATGEKASAKTDKWMRRTR